MSRWRTLVAFVVLALWMPATSHCALEAAGMLEIGECCAGDSAGSHTTADGCAPVERELSNAGASDVVASAPVLFFAYTLAQPVRPADLETVAVIDPVDNSEVDEWLVQWDFERRAALPARAPSLNV